MVRCLLEEGELIVEGPDFISTAAAIEAPSPLAWIGINPAAIESHGEHAGEHYPCIVSLAAGLKGEAIAPVFKYAAATLLRKCRDREIPKSGSILLS